MPGRAVLDVAHRQTASQGSKEHEERFSRRALVGAAAIAAAAAAAAAAALLLGTRSAAPALVSATEPVLEGTPANAPTKQDPGAVVHNVDATCDQRRTALCSLPLYIRTPKLLLFPALVTLCSPNLAQSRELLLDAVNKIDDCAQHLDLPQTSWLLATLLERVRQGHSGGAAYARVVARGRALGLPDAAELNASLLQRVDVVKEYIDAISADLVTIGRVVEIARALERAIGPGRTYASIIEIDRSLAAIAQNALTQKDESVSVSDLVNLGAWLPETMGVILQKERPEALSLDGKPKSANLAVSLMEARLIVAAKMHERNDRREDRFMFTDAIVSGLRDELASEIKKLDGNDNQKSVFVADTIVFLANLSPLWHNGDDLLAVLKVRKLIPSSMVSLWQRHALVRTVVSADKALLAHILDDNKVQIDKVICHAETNLLKDASFVDAVSNVISRYPANASNGIERVGVSALQPFLATIEAVIGPDSLLNPRLSIASSVRVRYAAALGRSGRRAKSGLDIRPTMDALKAAWEVAPKSVLDAAKYYNVGGKDLFDLLVAGARWGRYEQISQMTILFGDWTPGTESFVDTHARIVGAFFGFCSEAGDSDSMHRRWFCSESGSHDDAMVALVFKRKATDGAFEEALAFDRERGVSGIHGFLLVPGNGPRETKGWANAPGALHAEKVSLVSAACKTNPSDVVRAVRMTPWLVTFVDPSEAPMLMALVTLVPECAGFLDPAQLDALSTSRSEFSPAVEDACLIVASVQAGSADINARVYAALSVLRGLITNKREAKSAVAEEDAEEGKEVGEADMRRMLSAAYTDEIRGVQGTETYISTHVLGQLSPTTEKGSRLIGVATALITEYNALLVGRKLPGWGVPVRYAMTPRLESLFGRKRQFV
jgi:hypothetical protein